MSDEAAHRLVPVWREPCEVPLLHDHLLQRAAGAQMPVEDARCASTKQSSITTLET